MSSGLLKTQGSYVETKNRQSGHFIQHIVRPHSSDVSCCLDQEDVRLQK